MRRLASAVVTAALAVALAVALASCDTADQQIAFRVAAFAPPQGFTRTDASGATLDTDADDWRTAPAYGPASEAYVYVAQPLYPNPASASSTLTLQVVVQGGTVPGGFTVLGYVERAGQAPISYPLYQEFEAGPGIHTLQITPANAPAFLGTDVLRRIVVFDGQGEVVTYGDLRFP